MIGQIVQYAGQSIPAGYLLCDGSEVSRTIYAELFAVVGETFGAGDGSTTFNLPDLQGKAPAIYPAPARPVGLNQFYAPTGYVALADYVAANQPVSLGVSSEFENIQFLIYATETDPSSLALDLMAYWPGGNFLDQTENYTLTDHNTVGQHDGYWSFNAADSEYLSINLPLPNSWTISIWVKYLGTDFYIIMEKYYASTSKNIMTYINYPNISDITVNITDGSGSNWVGGWTESGFSPGDWIHVVMGWDHQNSVFRAINGNYMSEPTSLTYFNAQNVLSIGAQTYYAGTTRYFNGEMKQFAVWQRALTQGEINLLSIGYTPL